MSLVIERNLRYLESIQPAAARLLRRASPSGSLLPVTTRDGHPGFRTARKTIHSLYAPYRDAARTAGRTVGSDTATVVVFGLGGGFLAQTLIRDYPGVVVIVVERSWNILRTILERVDLSKEIARGRLRLTVTPDELLQTLRDVHVSPVRPEITTTSLDPWVEHEENLAHFTACRTMYDRFRRETDEEARTIRRFGRRWLVHTLHNTRHMRVAADGTSAFRRLHAIIQKKRVVIAAAGPSLDRFLAVQADALRSGLYTIIAVDTALPALLQRGITPLAVVVLDPQCWSILHIRETLPENVFLLLDAGVTPGIANRTREDSILWFVGLHPLHRLLFSRGAPVCGLPLATVSVTEAAIALTRGLGADRIELVGADGGFPHGTTYGAGTYHYGLATRRAHRLTPQSTFFADQVYPNTSATDRNGLFFSSATLDERFGRLLATLRHPVNLAFPATPAAVRFDPDRFWKHHLMELDRSIERLTSAEIDHDPAMPQLMALLGPHGVAHLPAASSLQESGYTGTGPLYRQIAVALKKIRGFILEENDRY